MNFYDLYSIVSANKQTFTLQEPTDSFSIATERTGPYIEPALLKSEFEQEKPTIILVSAVGATGKTTLAQVLSHRCGLPLLDLAKHKPVGDYTLTGLLTTAFRPEHFGPVIEAISKGSYGVIIDGVDEGRSKTNEGAFDAFLDDVARLCKNASSPTFVLLGRTQILDTCWLYFIDKGIKTGLLTIAPFDLEQARAYVDRFTGGLESDHQDQYRSVRDLILEKLSGAFGAHVSENDQTFLSFIGYPPVLDAIVTLLSQEKNYHKLAERLTGPEIRDVEIGLLDRIAGYLLEREKSQKVVPNILNPLADDMPAEGRPQIIDRVFDKREQCLRLISYCLGRQVALGVIGIPHLDEKYEGRLCSFLLEHPFILGRRFQNAVFEAYAIATLILSLEPADVDLALEYVDRHKYNYHLVYLLSTLGADRQIPIKATRLILGSALEFRTRTASVEVEIEADDSGLGEGEFAEQVDIDIDVTMGSEKGQSRSFAFHSHLIGIESVNLGPRLSSTFVSLPCEVVLSSSEELEFTTPSLVSAKKIVLQSRALTLRSRPGLSDDEKLVVLESDTMASSLERITTNGVDLVIAVSDWSGLTYPIIKHAVEKPTLTRDPMLKEKYMRLRRILVEFRSHSRGELARYKHKIENKRVLGSGVGQKVLSQLLRDGILRLSDSHYFLEPSNVHKYLGVSWSDLRKGAGSEKLASYLIGIA